MKYYWFIHDLIALLFLDDLIYHELMFIFKHVLYNIIYDLYPMKN